jgi:hypothetical protein
MAPTQYRTLSKQYTLTAEHAEDPLATEAGGSRCSLGRILDPAAAIERKFRRAA